MIKPCSITFSFSSLDTVSVTISDTMLTPLEGEEINITCIIRGIPLPNITWYKDGELFPTHLPPAPQHAPLPKAVVTSEEINRTVVKWQLKFTSVNRSDAGNYTCSASQWRGGEIAMVTSSTASLIVLCKHHIFLHYRMSSYCITSTRLMFIIM